MSRDAAGSQCFLYLIYYRHWVRFELRVGQYLAEIGPKFSLISNDDVRLHFDLPGQLLNRPYHLSSPYRSYEKRGKYLSSSTAPTRMERRRVVPGIDLRSNARKNTGCEQNCLGRESQVFQKLARIFTGADEFIGLGLG